MSYVKFIRIALTVTASILALAGAQAAMAQKAPSTLAMLNAMVRNGVISQEQANKILSEASAEDAVQEQQDGAPLQVGASQQGSTKRVTYVPEVVKEQLRNEIKQQVMAQAKAENWAAPNSHPEWTERMKLEGDARVRYEAILFPKGNIAGAGFTTNYNAINSGSPLRLRNSNKQYSVADIARGFPEPLLNVDEDRERLRLRGRLGLLTDLGENFSSGFRIASGDSNSPVSTNQSLGASGGNFSKYQVWLDRAYIRWSPRDFERLDMTVSTGRFDNPFFGTDLIWDDDLGFDGFAVQASYELTSKVKPFVTFGAFPVFNTDLNFSTYQSSKSNSENKWLYGFQGGVDWTPRRNLSVKLGAGYYYFQNIQGRRSSPCAVLDANTTCDTDGTRTPFSQKGNTYMGVRNLQGIDLDGNVANGDENDFFQYFGLAMPYHELALTGRVEYSGLGSMRLTLDGEAVRNLGFTKKNANFFDNNLDGNDNFDGGDTGYLFRVTLGSQEFKKRWDWNTSIAYKYVETDAVVDGLADSDFGLGGTNLKGFILGGNLALARNVSAGLRWMSADGIVGPRYSVDTFLANISAKF